MNAVALFVQAAMGLESDGWEVPDGLGPGEFIFEDVVYEVGSFEHMLLAAAVTGANSQFFRDGLSSA